MHKKQMTADKPSRVGNVFLPTTPTKVTSQSGGVLIISLIMLLLLTLIGITGMQTTSLEEKMAGNMRDKNLAFQAAESALKAAQASLEPPNVLPLPFPPDGTGGFYSSTPTVSLADTEIKSDSFWTANPVAPSSVTNLGNDIVTPKYIIQQLSTPKAYRITVRATGGSANAVVILQSIYLRS